MIVIFDRPQEDRTPMLWPSHKAMGRIAGVGVVSSDRAILVDAIGESIAGIRDIERGNGGLPISHKATEEIVLIMVNSGDVALLVDALGEGLDTARDIERGDGAVLVPYITLV